jgi:multicomponent K+:H+ antiporter subunit D
LPPLPGFIGKVAILRGVMASETLPPGLGWAFVALLLVSGLATLIGLVRIGIQTFWASDGVVPRVLALEIAPVLALCAMILLLTVRADDALRYMRATAEALYRPTIYAEGVLRAPRVVHGPVVAPAAAPAPAPPAPSAEVQP